MADPFVAPLRGVRTASAAVALVMVIAGCASNAGASISPPAVPSEAASAAPSSEPASPSASAASPSAAAASPSAATPSGSASAGSATCMDPATLDLLTREIMAFDTLTPAQRDQILAAVKAYDFGTDTASAALRDDLVAAIEAADFTKVATFAGQMVMGKLSFVAC